MAHILTRRKATAQNKMSSAIARCIRVGGSFIHMFYWGCQRLSFSPFFFSLTSTIVLPSLICTCLGVLSDRPYGNPRFCSVKYPTLGSSGDKENNLGKKMKKMESEMARQRGKIHSNWAQILSTVRPHGNSLGHPTTLHLTTVLLETEWTLHIRQEREDTEQAQGGKNQINK